MVPTGHAQTSFVKTMQGPNETYTDFLARLRVAVEQAVGRDEISGILLQTLAFENANPECKHILAPLKGQGASIAEYIRACLGVGGWLSASSPDFHLLKHVDIFLSVSSLISQQHLSGLTRPPP